MAELLSNIPHP